MKTGVLQSSHRRDYLAAVMIFALTLVFPLPALGAGFEHERVQFHGYFTLEYFQATADEGHDRPGAPDATNGSFDMHHFNLLFDIRILPELTAKLHIEFDHGADTELNAGDIVMEYGFFEYTLRDWLVFRGGKTLTPFGLFNEIHDASPAFDAVLWPENIYDAKIRGGRSFIPKWNTGLAVQGEMFFGSGHHDLYYILYVGNGESRPSTNEAEFDDNPNKALGGRLFFSTHEETFQAGLSAYYGDRAVTEDNLAVEHFSWLASGRVNYKGFSLMAEVGQSELGEDEQIAWLVQASYRIKRFTPYLRYQVIDPSEDEEDDHWNTLLGGVVYRVNDYMLLKAEWNDHRRGKANHDVNNEGDEDFGEFRSAIVLYF